MTSFTLARACAVAAVAVAAWAALSLVWYPPADSLLPAIAATFLAWAAWKDTEATRRYRKFLRQQRANAYYKQATGAENRQGVQ